MNTVIRITLGVAAIVAVGGAAGLVFLVFQGAAACARSGVHATPLEVLEAAVVDQAMFVGLGFFVLFAGYLLGVRAVVRRLWHVPTRLDHLLIAAVLASATLVLVAVPFMFAG